MFKNIRYLKNFLGNTDISSIGDGTITGGISALNKNLGNYAKRITTVEYTGTTTGNGYLPTDIGVNDYFILSAFDGTGVGFSVQPVAVVNNNKLCWWFYITGTATDVGGNTIPLMNSQITIWYQYTYL